MEVKSHRSLLLGIGLDVSSASVHVIVVFDSAVFASGDYRCIDSDVSDGKFFVDFGRNKNDCRRADAAF